MLEVEDWTQPSQNKRRASSRKISIEKTPKDNLTAITAVNSPPNLPPVIATGPPETEVEDTFRVTHSPNSQFFPVRQRSNSSPGTRPSSLSRLLAQAPENSIDALTARHGGIQPDEITTHENAGETSSSPPSPAPGVSQSPTQTSPPPTRSPHLPAIISSVPQNFSSQASPLRPGSRASRLSTTSKFSGRIPTLGTSSPGTAKAPATTALADQILLSSSPSNDGNPFGSPVTPSSEESLADGMNNLLHRNLGRRRTTSYHTPRSSPLAGNNSLQNPAQAPARPVLTAAGTLASLATNWGFGRRRKTDVGSLLPPVESPPPEEVSRQEGPSDRISSDTSARDLLKRL